MMHTEISKVGRHADLNGAHFHVVADEVGFTILIGTVDDMYWNNPNRPSIECEMCGEQAVYIFDATNEEFGLGPNGGVDMFYCQKHAHGAIAYEMENGATLELDEEA